MDVVSSQSTNLEVPPSAVAFCPSHPRYYVVGTYFLHPTAPGEPTDAPQKRTGTLILYRLEGTEFTHVQTVPLDSAVLDIEWTPHEPKLGSTLCVATSTGSLEFFAFDATAEKLEQTSSKQISDKETLVLDLLWHPSRADIIAVTLSDGTVSLCQSDDSTNPWSSSSQTTITELTTHSLEPWTLAFSPDTSHIFSGGDDAALQSMQVSCDSESDGDASPSSMTLWTDRRTHEAGVTAILPLANDLLITGSYDDNIRLISAPPVGRRQVLADLNLGGGVWRLRMLDDGSAADDDSPEHKSYTLLASCMHAGSRIVRLESPGSSAESSGEWAFSVLAKFEEHKSMNYGSDVQPVQRGKEGGQRTIVSTSFYDKLMCVWQFGQ
ncbi:hypothetical protein MBLNU13_g08599t1 [Cladosporium sp. NU13]